jgi:drug/metabolite transporter (DMT)-like permease
MQTNRRHAFAALVTAGTLWGTTVPLSKVALEWLPPVWLTAARFGLAAAILLPAARSRLRAACSPAVLITGALGYGGSVILQNAGVSRTSVSQAALLFGAVPVLIAIIAAAWHRTMTRPVAWLGFAVSLAGVGLITGAAGGGTSAGGDGLVLASLLLSATFTVAQARQLNGRDPVALTAVQFAAAAVAALVAALGTEGLPAIPSRPGPVLAVGGLAIAGTLLPFTLFAYGQTRVPAPVAGAFINIEPLVGVLTGVLFFGNPMGLPQLAGGAAIGAGIALSSVPGIRRTGREPGRARAHRRSLPQCPVLPGA